MSTRDGAPGMTAPHDRELRDTLRRALHQLFLWWRARTLSRQLPCLAMSRAFGALRYLLSSQARATFVGILVFLIVVIAGWKVGVAPVFEDRDPGRGDARVDLVELNALDEIYFTLQLVSFDGSWMSNKDYVGVNRKITPTLNVVRFLLPIAAVFSLLLVFMRRAGDALQLWLMPRWQHTVVCGLGEAGYAFVSHWMESGGFWRHGPLLVIECDRNNPHIDACRMRGIPVIEGDSTSVRVLRKARVHRARRIVSLLPNDGADIEMALCLQAYIDHHWSARMRRFMWYWLGLAWIQNFAGVAPATPVVIAQIDSPLLARRLEYYDKIARMSHLDVRFHNIYKVMAIRMLLQHPPEYFADLFNVPQPHFVIYGFGHLGQQVMIEAIRLCQYRNGNPPKFTIVDEDEAKVNHFLSTEFPGMTPGGCADTARVADIDVIGHYFKTPSVTRAEADKVLGDDATPTQHVVCFDDDEFALTFALSLQAQLHDRAWRNAPIFVRASKSRGMATLLDSKRGGARIPDSIFAFGMVDEAASPESLDNAYIECLAKAIHHCGYLHGSNGQSVPANMLWHKLSDVFRRTNRHAAMHLDVKLRAVGLRRVQANDRPPCKFEPAQTKVLVRLEHQRFCASRLASGWRMEAQSVPAADSYIRHDPSRRHDKIDAYRDTRHLADNEAHIEYLPFILGADASAIAGTAKDPARVEMIQDVVAPFEGARGFRCLPEFHIAVVQCSVDFQIVRYPEIDPAAYAPVIARLLADAADKAVTIHTPGVYFAEQQFCQALHGELLKARPRYPRSFFQAAERDTISITLPMPYAHIEYRIDGAIKGAMIDDRARDQMRGDWKRWIQDAVAREDVRYLEMPLTHGTFARLADSEVEAAQFQSAWGYLYARCDALVILYVEGETDRLQGLERPVVLRRRPPYPVAPPYRLASPVPESLQAGWYFPPVSDGPRRFWPICLEAPDSPRTTE